ncbi:MAG: hypothetical protein WDM92_08200 [Caulobacteraceae bacterium]
MECSEATWRGLGFDAMDQDDARRACEAIFAGSLDGHPLISNAAHLRGGSAAWINFRRVLCDHWSFVNVVLLGDAAHTAALLHRLGHQAGAGGRGEAGRGPARLRRRRGPARGAEGL